MYNTIGSAGYGPYRGYGYYGNPMQNEGYKRQVIEETASDTALDSPINQYEVSAQIGQRVEDYNRDKRNETMWISPWSPSDETRMGSLMRAIRNFELGIAGQARDIVRGAFCDKEGHFDPVKSFGTVLMAGAAAAAIASSPILGVVAAGVGLFLGAKAAWNLGSHVLQFGYHLLTGNVRSADEDAYLAGASGADLALSATGVSNAMKVAKGVSEASEMAETSTFFSKFSNYFKNPIVNTTRTFTRLPGKVLETPIRWTANRFSKPAASVADAAINSLRNGLNTGIAGHPIITTTTFDAGKARLIQFAENRINPFLDEDGKISPNLLTDNIVAAQIPVSVSDDHRWGISMNNPANWPAYYQQ